MRELAVARSNASEARLAIACQNVSEVQLRLKIFDCVPEGFILEPIHNDHMAPLLTVGDVAVIEHTGTAGWLPVDGGLFLIEYVSEPTLPWQRQERRTRSVCQTKLHQGKIGPAYWWACPLDHGDAVSGGSIMNCSDGPYEEEQLTNKLLGPVVGIYRPDCGAL